MKINIVIADSSTWLNYFEKDKTKDALILETLIKENKIAICYYVLIEILKDIKNKETFEKLLKCFLALPYVEIEKEDWIKAANILFKAKQKGLNLTTEQAVLNALCETKKLTLISKKLEGGKNGL